jgi:hypothetical protein
MDVVSVTRPILTGIPVPAPTAGDPDDEVILRCLDGTGTPDEIREVQLAIERSSLVRLRYEVLREALAADDDWS